MVGIGFCAECQVRVFADESHYKKEDSSLLCAECSVPTLVAEVERLRKELNGDGLLTLSEQVDHAREYIGELTKKYEDMTSIALWAARRLSHPQRKDFVYDEIEANLGREVERD